MHFAWRDYAENVEGVASHSFVCLSQDKDAGGHREHRPKCSDMHASPGPGLHVSPDSGMFRWIVPWLSCRSWCIKYGVMDGVLCRENHQAKHSAVKNLPDSA